MRYHCIHIRTDFAEEWQKDLFDQQISELGVDTIDAEDYYIQSELWAQNADEIESFCATTAGVTLLGADACPDENWNAAWEAEHPIQELPLDVKIVPHCAFGAGHHETTSLMIDALLSSDLTDKSVLDHGTGTGVLAIFAKKRGADKVVAVDIDEKSVENAKENAALNDVSIEVLHSSEFSFQNSAFSLILANIHRNILMEYMPAYAASLQEGGELWISGFYEADCAPLQDAAKQQGLTLIQVLSRGGWMWMKYRKEERL
jgi:ribosomal protein L11 methyltransferase